jgi:glycine/D-amino acid oxidase-like deaminating enzyme
VDVAIVGSGFTGLAAARELARRGARVAVLEAQTIGWGASSRNGGMVLNGLKLGARTLLLRYGRELAQRMFNASRLAVNCVEQIVAEEHIECDFARCGHLEAACKPGHVAELEKEADCLARDFNYHVQPIAQARLRSEIGSTAYYGGLVDEKSAGLNPARYVHGLARAAAEAGARLYEHTRVQRAAREGPEFRIVTSRGRLRATHMLVATSGYTGALVPALQRRIVPIGSYMIATQPLPEKLARELSQRRRMIYDTKNFLYYFRLSPDNRMVFGGRAGFFPESPRVVRESAEILRRGMIRVYPQLREAAVEYVWGGTLDFAFDRMPHVGHLEGVYYALGYAGHGVALATYFGSRLGAQIGGDAWDNPFAEIPFSGAPLGLYDGRPWFLPLAGAWYRFMDWIG